MTSYILSFFLLLILLFTTGCGESVPSPGFVALPANHNCYLNSISTQADGAITLQRDTTGVLLGASFSRNPANTNTFVYNANGRLTGINSQTAQYSFEYTNSLLTKVTHTEGQNAIEARQEYDEQGRVEKERLTGFGPAYQQQVNLVVVSGQSNAGEALLDGLSPGNAYITQPVNGVYFYDWRNDQRWETVNETPPTKVGPHHQIAYLLKKAYPTQGHYILPRAFGGASLYFQTNGFHFEPAGNSAYPLLISSINDAVAALSAENKRVTTISLVWVHGERDAGNKGNVDGYAAKFNELTAAITNDTGLPFRTIILQEVHNKLNPRSKPYIDDLVGQMRQIAAQSDSYFSFSGNDSEISSDNIHFTANGYIQNGSLAFELLNLTYGSFNNAPEVNLPKTVFYRYDGSGNLIKRIVRYNSGPDENWFYTYDSWRTPDYVGLHRVPVLPLYNIAYFTVAKPINVANIVQVTKTVANSPDVSVAYTYNYTYNQYGLPESIEQVPANSATTQRVEMTYWCSE